MKNFFLLLIILTNIRLFCSNGIFSNNIDKKEQIDKSIKFDLSIDTDVYSNYGVDIIVRRKILKLFDIGILTGFQIQRFNKSDVLKPVFTYDFTAFNSPLLFYTKVGYDGLSLQPLIGYHLSTQSRYNGFSIGSRFSFSNLYFENIIIFSNKEENIFTFGYQFHDIFN